MEKFLLVVYSPDGDEMIESEYTLEQLRLVLPQWEEMWKELEEERASS